VTSDQRLLTHHTTAKVAYGLSAVAPEDTIPIRLAVKLVLLFGLQGHRKLLADDIRDNGCFLSREPRFTSSIDPFKTFIVTSVRLFLVSASVSTSGWRLISPALDPLNFRASTLHDC
jgi:hypothetical protein